MHLTYLGRDIMIIMIIIIIISQAQGQESGVRAGGMGWTALVYSWCRVCVYVWIHQIGWFGDWCGSVGVGRRGWVGLLEVF